MKKKHFCTCDLCKRHRKWEKFLKKHSSRLTKNETKFLDELYMDLLGTELNYDVDEAILDGSWPSSIDYLTEGLKKAEDIKRGREMGERI